jgi:DNA polymerase-1
MTAPYTLLDLARDLYPPFSDLLWKMERRGVFVSLVEVRRIHAEATRDSDDAAKALDRLAGGAKNWNSPADVGWFLYDHCGFEELPDDARSPKFWGKTRITASEALEYWWRHHKDRREPIELLRKYRRAERAKSYAAMLFEAGRPTEWTDIVRVHPTYGTYNDNAAGKRDKTGTATGRLSVSNPPLQQIPRDKKKDPYRVRRAFVAPPGFRLAVVDQEQLEVRIQAHVHLALFDDATLRNLATGGDFHGRIAHQVFSRVWPTFADHVGGWEAIHPDQIKDHPDPAIRWCRDQVKAVFYGLAYGKGEKAFGATLWTLDGDPVGPVVARSIMDGVFSEIPAIPRYQAWVEKTVFDKGGMWDIFGVWRPLEASRRGARQGLNQPFQGSGARIAMLWMLLMRGVEQVLQVHDEVHVIAPEHDADRTVEFMARMAEEAGTRSGLLCPLKGAGAHGTSWEDAK